MRRSAALWLAALILTGWETGCPSGASADDTWVRSESSTVRAAITLGAQRSATFRRLLESIDATDGLVYVIEGQCPRGVGACLPITMSAAGPRRLLRIIVNPRWFHGCEMVGAIAHELQHVMEVLENPNVRTTTSLFRLFERIGPTSSGTFETKEALEMERVVGREACERG